MKLVQMVDTLTFGGAQMMLVFLLESLRPFGVDITVVGLNSSVDPNLVAKLEGAGARVVNFPFPRLFSPASFIRLVIFLARNKFTLIHSYLTYSNIIGSLAGWILGIPVIASIRSADYEQPDHRSVRIRLENFALRHLARRILANGQSVAQFARSRAGKTPVDVIVNAVDVHPPLSEEQSQTIRSTLTPYPDRRIIVTVGRYSPVKGFFDLMDAVDILRTRHSDFVVTIVGTGRDYERAALSDYVRLKGLENYVSLAGSRRDVPDVLAASDIYVNSSLREGTPVSVLEAMAAGLPVVATAVGESPYLVRDDSGILVQPARPDELASALESLLESPEKRSAMGKAGFRYILRKGGRSVWVHDLLALYSKVAPEARDFLKLAESARMLSSESD